MAQKKIDLVGDYFISRADQDLTVELLSNDLGLEKNQIQSAIWTLRNRSRNPYPIVQVRTGVFRLDGSRLFVPLSQPKAEPTEAVAPDPTVFEVVGKAKSGKYILRCDTGCLYTAEPLDL